MISRNKRINTGVIDDKMKEAYRMHRRKQRETMRRRMEELQ
jgi:hypothetical protein